MNDGLYIYISDIIIASMNPVVTKTRLKMQEHYKLLRFQLLVDLPILCVSIQPAAFPELYPGVILVPESAWCDLDLRDQSVLMNADFAAAYLSKPTVEVTTVDLLNIFELLTDTDKLIEFADEHPLVIGGIV